MPPRDSLPTDIAKLLELEKTLTPVPIDVHERVASRLAVLPPVITETAHVSSNLFAKSAVKGFWLGRTMHQGFALGIALGGAFGFVASKYVGRTPPGATTSEQVTSRSTVSPPQLSAVLPPPMESAVPSVAPSSLPTVAVAAADKPQQPRSTANAPPGRTSEGDRTLLEVARTALARRDPEACLSALARHEKEFPTTSLAEERDMMWIQALAASNRKDLAKARAAKFRRLYPSSLFLAGVEEIVGTDP